MDHTNGKQQISLKDKGATDYSCKVDPIPPRDAAAFKRATVDNLDEARSLIQAPPSNDIAPHGADSAGEVVGSVTFDTLPLLMMANLQVLGCQYSTSPMATYDIKEGYHCWFYSHPENT